MDQPENDDGLSRRVLAQLRSSKRKHAVVAQLAAKIGCSGKQANRALDDLIARGEVIRTRKGHVALCSRLGLLRGTVRSGRRGRAVVVPDPADAPIALPRGGIRPAMNGDRVLVEVEPYTRRGLRNGKVKAVLERAARSLVGTVSTVTKGCVVLTPLDPRVGYVATFSDDSVLPAANLVIEAEIVEYPTSYRDPVVRFTKSLGPAGTLATEIVASCASGGISIEFDSEVEREVARLADPTQTALGAREDLRSSSYVTIDPVDAKDFDDAVSIQHHDGGYRLGVAIADVSHYVAVGSALDRAAYQRGTSVYFPGRCVPMLPERISGDLASLKPATDRLTLSVFLDVNGDGEIVASRFSRSIIHSRRRFTYEEAEDILAGAASSDSEIDTMLHSMAECAEAMHTCRMRRGAIDLDLPELEIELDDSGEPVSLRRKSRLRTHRLIEEFMLAANEAVARELERHNSDAQPLAFLYRIHLKPDADAVDAMATKLLPLGYRIAVDTDGIRPATIQALINQAAGSAEQALVNLLVLRSMQQARYSERKAGHFGLASSSYTHFTSPIRRYPDLVVHRALCALLDRTTAKLPSHERLAGVAEHCSHQERRAVDAERDITAAATVMIMRAHIGREFDGTVTNVQRYGYYVELDGFFVEGFVSVARLREYYSYLPERMELHAKVSGDVIAIGARLRVRLTAADLAERALELTPTKQR